VRDILEDSDALAIIKAVLDLGASLGIVTTAEGVETLEQLDALRGQGCAEIQGYFISRPAPASEIARLLGMLAAARRRARRQRRGAQFLDHLLGVVAHEHMKRAVPSRKR
jgi:predicted signal transduction protein with EAL and GGDEF domain